MWKTASVLMGLVLILVTLGVIMLASTSAVRGESQFHNPNYFLLRQLLWLGLAAVVCAAAARLDYHHLRWVAIALLAGAIGLLGVCFVPHVGLCINGSRRWIKLAGLCNFQPSEFAKYAIIVFLAWWMKQAERRAGEFFMGMVVPGAGLAAVLGLIFLEPDFGTTMLTAVVGMSMLFLGGTRLRYLTIAAVVGFCGFAFAVMENPNRMTRILAFLNPAKYAEKEAFQLMNALYAFVAGGSWGAGLGQGLQKHFYLPECHTDFILPSIAEELGLGGSLGVLLLFVGIFVCGMLITGRAPDVFGRLIAFGITLMITIQAMINIGVVTGCLPTKGLALPFISYGGSSLLVSGLMVGTLVNIALHAGGGIRDEDTRMIKDRAHSV